MPRPRPPMNIARVEVTRLQERVMWPSSQGTEAAVNLGSVRNVCSRRWTKQKTVSDGDWPG